MSCPFPPDSPFRCLTSDKRSARLPHLARAIHSAALSASAKRCELIQAAYAILVASTLFPDKFRSEWLSGFDDVAEIRIVEGLADLLFCFDMKVVRVHRVAKRLLVNLSKPFQQTRWRTHNFVDFTFIFDTLQKNSKQEKSMARSDMRDFEWDFIKKLLPNKSRGVKRVDDRRVINGILYALRTGIPWRDMPEQYGPWSTIYNRFNRWSKAGIWDMIFEAIVDSHNVNTVMVDSTSVRAHPTAAKLKKTDKRRCLGRSRGGLGTKIHASNNQDGLPLKLELTPNQANDAPPCGTLLTGLQPGQWVLADKAYDVNWIRNMIWEQGAIDVIPSKSNRKIPKEFDKVMYRQRNKIERFFGRLKASFRRIATRYEHTSANFLAMIKLACVRLWLEFYEYAA